MTTAARRCEPVLRGAEAQPAQQNAANRSTMKELTNPGWIKLKGFLFLIVGAAAALLVILENGVKTGILLAISIWCFCRFYYFAFYVIQHYVDEQYRFSGLWSFARYLIESKVQGPKSKVEPPSKSDCNAETTEGRRDSQRR